MLNTTLADLVIEDSRRARVLESLGLDYCCHGRQTLAEAVAGAGLQANAVTAQLTFAEAPPAPAAGAAAGTSAALAHDIVDTHHAYMWEGMPRLAALIDKVHRVHGDRHPELVAVQSTYREAVAALDPHMTLEERSVFPAISRLEKGVATPVVIDLATAVDRLVAEHTVVGDLFARIRELTDGYRHPEDACGSYIRMLDALAAMEADLHEHIHLENNVLFPQALKLIG